MFGLQGGYKIGAALSGVANENSPRHKRFHV
jgi:hypothetical protein